MTAEGRDPIDEAALRERVLGRQGEWRRVDVVAETGSTNADLIARAAAGEDVGGSVLIAEHQTAGRGRQGRTWHDSPGALITMSVGVDAAAVPADDWGWLPLATGIAIVDTVTALGGAGAGLKWPNDVLVSGRKLAGILAEVAAPQRVVVVGVGLNVTLRPDEVDAPEATALADLGVDTADRGVIVAELLGHLGARIAAWQRRGSADLMDDYRSRCLTLGSRVRAILPDGNEVVGMAIDVDSHGRLRIDRDGEAVLVSAGDVVHLRPAT